MEKFERHSSGPRDRDRDSRDSRDSRDRGDFEERVRRPRGCRFCMDKKLVVDHKQEDSLRYFISESRKILPRRLTNLCAYHQRQVTRVVKKARILGILPFSATHRNV